MRKIVEIVSIINERTNNNTWYNAGVNTSKENYLTTINRIIKERSEKNQYVVDIKFIVGEYFTEDILLIIAEDEI